MTQLRLEELDQSTRAECDAFINLLRASPGGVQSVSLMMFPILGQRLAEFADDERWKGLQCK